jgi:hypothetical protein
MFPEAPQPSGLMCYPPYWTFQPSPPVPRYHALCPHILLLLSLGVPQLMFPEAPQSSGLMCYPPYWTFQPSPPIPLYHAPCPNTLLCVLQ